MAAGGLPIRVNNIFVRENDCSGAVIPLADGGRSWFFGGYDSTQIDVGLTFETIAAIASECYNRSASQRVSGADSVLNLGCGFSTPEFTSAFITGMHQSTGIGGVVQTSFDKPGEDACKTCAKTESEDCDPAFSIIVDYCEVDCDDKVIDRKFMVIRNVSQATLANRKRVGGNNPDSFGGDINLTIETNDGYGYGPGGLLVSDGPDGEPECSSVTCDIACPAGLDFSDIDEFCGCSNEHAGCTVDAALVAAVPELDFDLLTL